MAVRRIRTKAEIVKTKKVEVDRHPIEKEPFEVGQWYWVTSTDEDKPWIACVVHVGSNYVKVKNPFGTNERVHFDESAKVLKRELDPRAYLDGRVDHYRKRVADLMEEVRELTARLGVAPRQEIEHRPGSETYALVKVTADTDTGSYKRALIRAKDKELPELFEKIRVSNEKLSTWMKAEMIPLMAGAGKLKGLVKKIEGRIFNVSLYAGLTESVTQILEGEPAPYEERLRLMQRRAYMDEECLLDYQHGGMEFKKIEKFDQWLAKPKNLNRILPHPRCLVAMRVRRTSKDRGARSIFESYINVHLGRLDESTFLYIRNGEQLYRMSCDLEFDELIFPNRGEFDMTQPMMFRLRYSNDEVELITAGDYAERLKGYKKAVADAKLWKRNNPVKDWIKAWKKAHRVEDSRTKFKLDTGRVVDLKSLNLEWSWRLANPYEDSSGCVRAKDPRGQWDPFDQDSVYYDEVMADLKNRIDYYNRLALIVQGLYDRSTVLHPHGPVKTWTPEGFAEAVELVYDQDRALHAGPAPSFDDYSTGLRSSIKVGSVVIGQESEWLNEVQAKEEERRSNRWRRDSSETPKTWKPDGDDGPGFMSEISQIRAGKAKFVWLRSPRVRGYGRASTDPVDMVEASFSVELSGLFNVSAYKPGDYLRFFEDPRTRAQYLKWAPCLLSAEDYHAGKRKAQKPPSASKVPDMKTLVRLVNVHLGRMEADKEFNKTNSYGACHFYYANAWASGRVCTIKYVTYQCSTTLEKSRVLSYLRWLDAGNRGTHHMQDHEKTRKKKAKKKRSR